MKVFAVIAFRKTEAQAMALFKREAVSAEVALRENRGRVCVQ